MKVTSTLAPGENSELVKATSPPVPCVKWYKIEGYQAYFSCVQWYKSEGYQASFPCVQWWRSEGYQFSCSLCTMVKE